MKCKRCDSKFKGNKCPNCGAVVPCQNVSLILGIIQALFFACAVVALNIYGKMINFEESAITINTVVLGSFALIIFILSFFSRKYKWANIIIIVLSGCSVISLMGVIGGALGLSKLIKKEKTLIKEGEALKANQQQQVEEAKGNLLNYQYTSPLLEQLRDEKNKKHIMLYEEDKEIEFEKKYVTILNNKIYCILKYISIYNTSSSFFVDKKASEETAVYCLEENSKTGEHKLAAVSDELAQKIYNEYESTLGNNTKIKYKNKERKKKNTILDKIVDKLKSEKPDNAGKSVFIILTVLYSLLLVISIVSFFTNFFNVFKGKEEIFLCKITSLVVLASVPSYLIYFNYSSPYSRQKSKIALNIIAILLHIGLFVFLYIQAQFLLADTSLSMPFLMPFLLCVAMIITTDIFYYKSKDIPSVIKLFIPILAIICCLIVVVGVTIYLILSFFRMLIPFLLEVFGDDKFVKSFRNSFQGKESSSEGNVYEIYDGGYKRILTYYDNYDGHDCYKDDVGNYWCSDDNGKTFYRE